ncbi:hypothetical protein Tco_1142746 [Tanacetum coccineum]
MIGASVCLSFQCLESSIAVIGKDEWSILLKEMGHLVRIWSLGLDGRGNVVFEGGLHLTYDSNNDGQLLSPPKCILEMGIGLVLVFNLSRGKCGSLFKMASSYKNVPLRIIVEWIYAGTNPDHLLDKGRSDSSRSRKSISPNGV